MPNHDARAIANEFLFKRKDNAWPEQIYIQKLTHIANGWNLAINGVPLVSEVPRAWDNGPVFKSIWDHLKVNWYDGPYSTLVDPTTKEPYSAELTDRERKVVDHVWRKYGNLTGSQLSNLTHEQGTPWEKAYFGRGRNAPLDIDEIKNHYTELALAGRGK
jgi:uncharacterized phage-associated protein